MKKWKSRTTDYARKWQKWHCGCLKHTKVKRNSYRCKPLYEKFSVILHTVYVSLWFDCKTLVFNIYSLRQTLNFFWIQNLANCLYHISWQLYIIIINMFTLYHHPWKPVDYFLDTIAFLKYFFSYFSDYSWTIFAIKYLIKVCWNDKIVLKFAEKLIWMETTGLFCLPTTISLIGTVICTF